MEFQRSDSLASRAQAMALVTTLLAEQDLAVIGSMTTVAPGGARGAGGSGGASGCDCEDSSGGVAGSGGALDSGGSGSA